MKIALLIRYATFILAIAGVIVMTSVMQTIHGQDNASIPPPPVTPPAKPYPEGVAATGIIEALNENVAIGIPAPGVIREVKVLVWDKVKKNDILLIIDDRELRAALGKQNAAIAVSQANLDVSLAQSAKSRATLDRLKSVTDQRAISQDDVTTSTNDLAISEAEVFAARAQVEAAKADVNQTQLLIERLTVRSPKDATVLQVNIRAGEYASSQNNATPLILGDVDTLQVRVDVDEQNAMRIRSGQAATAFLKGDSATPFPLQFERIEPFVVPKVSLTGASTERVDTRVLQVIYRLPKPKDTHLYVGQQVDVFISVK